MEDDKDPLATIEQLQARLPFTMDTSDQAEATGALEDLSDEARYFGRSTWINPGVTPQPVIRLVLRAAVRYMKNYEGFVMSRAGDETVQWVDRGEDAGAATFTAEEKARLREYGGSSAPSLQTVDMFIASPCRARHVPGLIRDDNGVPLHYFSHDEDPW